MRLFPALIAACTCLMLAGCGDKSAVSADEARILSGLSSPFHTSASIRYGSLTAETTVARDSPLSCTVVFTAPESLRDMAYTFREESVELSYKGLQFSFDPSGVPDRSAAKAMVSALAAATQGTLTQARRQGNELEAQGTGPRGLFTLLLDAESGALIKLSVPQEELEIIFSDFSFLS